jgi:hypothetical protein
VITSTYEPPPDITSTYEPPPVVTSTYEPPPVVTSTYEPPPVVTSTYEPPPPPTVTTTYVPPPPPPTTTITLESTFSPFTASATSFATTLSGNPQPSGSAGDLGTLVQLYQCAPCGGNTCSFSADVSVFVYGICHIIRIIPLTARLEYRSLQPHSWNSYSKLRRW